MRASFSCAAALLLMAVGLAANAQDTLTVSYNTGTGEGVNVSETSLGVSNEATYAIPLTGTLYDASNNKLAGPFTVYCIDLDDTQNQTGGPPGQQVTVSSITPTSTVTTPAPPVTATELSEASYLINQYGSGATAQDQAALQLAIWGVVGGDTPGTIDLTSHALNFYVNSAVDGGAVTLADSYLASLGTALNLGGINGLGYGTLYEVNPDPTGLSHNAPGQNLLGDATPEGSTVALFAFGLAPLFGFKWLAARRRTAS